MVRCFPVTTDPQRIEDKLHDMTDGTTHVVAVEVYDHPESRYSERYGATIGPWVLGTPDEVDAFCAAHGWRDYEVQYGAGGQD